MANRAKPDRDYTIGLDGEWGLSELTEFSGAFLRLYAILFAIEYSGPLTDGDRRLEAFRQHAWRGSGFSAANFYTHARSLIPSPWRPRIVKIQYASPGFIQLALLVKIAASVGTIVVAVTLSIQRVTDLYHRIYKQLQERKLTRIQTKDQELALAVKYRDYLDDTAEALADQIGFKDLKELRSLTGNRLSTVKILLAITRVSLRLASKQSAGKASLPASGEPK